MSGRGPVPFYDELATEGAGVKTAPPVKAGGSEQVRSGGAYFGLFGRKNLPRTLQVIGAGLRQISDPSSDALNQFGANEAEQMRYAAEQAAQAREGKLEEQQRGYLDQAIGGLDPSMQPWARLAPAEAARNVFAGAPETYGDLEAIDGRLGQRNRRTGQYDWAPQVPAGDRYTPPAGYRGSPDAGLEPIPGGPADQRVNAEGRARLQQTDSSIRQLENAISSLPDSIQNSSAGFWGGMTRNIPGSGAYDLNQQLEPVRAILSFENLQEMRRNSTTGGALGSIAVRELELLGNTVRSLDTAQSPQQLASSIREVRRQLTRTTQALRAAREEVVGGRAGQMQSEAPAQERVMQWSPERGVY